MALTKVIGNGLGATQEGAITFNEGSADVDFRVESNGNANMLFVDGGENRVGIGSNAPVTLLHLQGSEPDIFLRRTDLTNKSWRLNVQSSTGDLNIKSRNDDGSASTTSMVIAHDGYVTKPLQPAFSVHKNATDQNNIATSETTVNWTHERFDNNADFDLGNNRFVAPVTGKYFLQINLRLENIDTAAAYYEINISTSNLVYRFIFDPDYFDSDAVYYSVAFSVLADMDASDTATISITQSSGTAQTDIDGNANYTWFSGNLVC